MNVNLQKMSGRQLISFAFSLYLHSFNTKFLFSFKNPKNQRSERFTFLRLIGTDGDLKVIT